MNCCAVLRKQFRLQSDSSQKSGEKSRQMCVVLQLKSWQMPGNLSQSKRGSMLFSANANRSGILRLRCKEKMNFKNVQYYSGLFFAGLMILLSSNIQVPDAAELTGTESITTLSEEQSSQTPTIFGGVGRKLPTWQAGLDLLILGTPHYSAFRNQLNLSNRVFWGEWWYNDGWGVKGFLSEQSFRMFGSSGSSAKSSTRHLGVIAKTQHSLSESWKISAGMGLANTEYSLGSQRKQGNSLVSEFRIGMEISDDFWTEAGILTIDSSSGSGSGDQRLGSTGYLIGFSYGF